MLKLEFTEEALEEYDSWLREGNVKILDKIDALLESVQQTPFSGIGKPEALKYQLTGKWSRRITQKDRLVYEVVDDRVVVHQCRGHY